MAKRQINKIILHCADTPTGKDFRESDINEWHKKRFKQSSNGHYTAYQWIICIDGVIEMGRLESDVGAHCKGHNADSIGICLIGRGVYTQDQMVSLLFLLEQTTTAYNLKSSDIYGHYEFTKEKQCPLIDMKLVRSEFETYISRRKNGTT